MSSHIHKKPIAIVMGRNYTSRLGMIRAAGTAGCDVVVIQTEHKKPLLRPIDSRSKYVVARQYIPEPDREGLIRLIQSYKSDGDKPVLLPTDDYTAATIDMNLDSLRDDFLLPHVNNEQGAVVRLMDKSLQKKIALEAGMNVAREWICEWHDDHYVIPSDVSYPCFTKPQLSSQGHLKRYQKKCNTPLELEGLLHSVGKVFHGPILVEDYHEISREFAVVGLSLKDYSLIPSVIEMKDSFHGITALGTLMPISRIPSMKEFLSDFMRRSQLTGLFDIDMYESGGKLYFNELNVRFGANGFALSNSVVNLPGLFLHYLLGHGHPAANSPQSFDSLTFANENILRQMYYEGLITYKQYRLSQQSANTYAIKNQTDKLPYCFFRSMDCVLPLVLLLKKLKKFIH